ncbi:MAG: hypothetical protein Q8N62_04560 [Candidatus Omnitrophota bacterium]|nr:hypothetical protein [Candidatus Omnitrophota bacterium]
MTINKKNIAREGLILLTIVGAGFAFRIIGTSGYPFAEWVDVTPFNSLDGFGRMMIILGYPFYILIRFIFWAIKTLGQK